MSLLLWAALLMFAALAFVILEAFLPSAGLLSVLAAASLIASIAMAFSESLPMGVLFLGIAAVGLPLLGILMLNFWPHTPIGQLILIARPDDSDDVLPETEEYRGLRSMIGKRGTARTMMLPSGAVTIENRVFDALSQGVAIEAGQPVEVIGVDMGHLVVMPLEESSLAETKAPHAHTGEESSLDRSLHDFGLDDLEEPLNS